MLGLNQHRVAGRAPASLNLQGANKPKSDSVPAPRGGSEEAKGTRETRVSKSHEAEPVPVSNEGSGGSSVRSGPVPSEGRGQTQDARALQPLTSATDSFR